MITPKDIEKKTMTPEKRAEANKSFFGFYVGRPISYVLTIPFLYLGIQPNTVTLLSIVFSLAGFCFLSFSGTLSGRLIGLLFVFLWNMGDGIDGNIARYRNIKSANGDLLDTLGGYIAMALILIGMGCATFNDVNSHFFINSLLPVVLGALSAAETLIPRLLMHRKDAMRNDKIINELKDKKRYGIPQIIILNICDPAGFQEVLMLISLLFGLCLEFTIFYFIVNTVVMIYSIRKLME